MSEDTVSKDGTDGLVTVAKVDSRLGDMSRLSIIDRPLSIGTEVCLRSQAEELLAAERAEKAGWKELHDAAQVAVKERTEACNNLYKQVNDLIADNAAKDARIKELEAKLETYHEEYENRKEGYEKTIDSLMEKLAAAGGSYE